MTYFSTFRLAPVQKGKLLTYIGTQRLDDPKTLLLILKDHVPIIIMSLSPSSILLPLLQIIYEQQDFQP